MNNRILFLFAALLAYSLPAHALGSCDFSQASAAQGASQSVSEDRHAASTPTRVVEERKELGNRTVVTRTLETLNVEGQYAPVTVCQEEIIKTDTNNQHTTQRFYGFDENRQRVLLELSEEHSKKLANGGREVMRTVSQPVAGGQLQIVRREVEHARPAGSNAQEIDTTVLVPDVNGGLSPQAKIHEIKRQVGRGVEETRSTQMLADGNGGWQTGEVREQTVRTDASGNRTVERRVLAPDANMNLSVKERSVVRETKETNGVQHTTFDTYGPAIGGSIGTVELDSSMQVVRKDTPGGGTQTQTVIEQRDLASPGLGMRVAQQTVEISRPNSHGGADTQKVASAPDANGSMTQITVSFQETATKK